MQPSTNSSFCKPARRSFESGGVPGSLLLGNNPQDQFGSGQVASPVTTGGPEQFSETAKSAGRGMLSSFQPMATPTVGYENGGTVSPFSLKGIGRAMGLLKTPEEKQAEAMSRIDAEQAAYRAKNKPLAPVATGISGYAGNTALDGRMKAAGLRDGGKITGPGTGTSDSISAEVTQTGEPISVSTGERIVSVAQDKLLQRIAKARGYESVDQMFEAETGKPVGPTIKGGKRAAAGGMSAEDTYLKALDAQKAATPSYFSQTTPTSGQRLKDATAAADAALQATYTSGTSQPGAGLTAPTTTPQVATAPTTSATAGYQGKGYLDPRRTDVNPADPALGASRDMTAELSGRPGGKMQALPTDLREGVVHKTVDAQGRVTYSGRNVGQQADGSTQMVDGTGRNLAMRGSLDVAAPGSVAMGAGGFAMTPADPSKTAQQSAILTAAMTNPDGSTWSAGDNAVMAANLRDGVEPYRGTSRAPKAAADKYADMPIKMATAMRVQDSQNASADKRSATQNTIAQGQLDLSKEDHAFKQDQAKQLAAAQAAYADPKATPEVREAAKRKLMALGALKANLSYHPGSKLTDPAGNQTVTEGTVFNNDTGEVRAATPGGQSALPQGMTKQVGTANGKPVYEDANGKRYQ